jgi:hypothetical protein
MISKTISFNFSKSPVIYHFCQPCSAKRTRCNFCRTLQQGMYTFAKCSSAILFCSEIAYLYGHATIWYYVDICVVLREPQVPDRNGQRWYQLAELEALIFSCTCGPTEHSSPFRATSIKRIGKRTRLHRCFLCADHYNKIYSEHLGLICLLSPSSMPALLFIERVDGICPIPSVTCAPLFWPANNTN